MSVLITSVLNSASDRLAISSSLGYIFSEALICSFTWAIFLVSTHLSRSKGQSLRCSQGGATHVAALWHTMWGRVLEGTIPLALLSAGFQSLPLLPTSKLGPSDADSKVGGFVYVLGPCGSLQ